VIRIALYLCPDCGNYEPTTQPGYNGQLSGPCTNCLLPKREVHRFIAEVQPHELGACSCSGSHDRREAA
jgi:hypothetical protein